METKQMIITVPKDLRLGQFLYNVLESNGYEHNVKISTFLDGKWTQDDFKGVDCFYLEDTDFTNMMTNWIKETELC